MIEKDVFDKELFCQLDPGEILHTMTAARAIGMTADELRRRLGESVITSLNHDREYIATREYVSEHCDRKGFWRKDGKVFHDDGSISQVLYRLIRTPRGITEAEAEKLTGRECGRKLRQLPPAKADGVLWSFRPSPSVRLGAKGQISGTGGLP